MAEEQKKMVPTLGLTGVTVNAMALIAPGAFLWITFVQQAGYAFPSGMAMWAGIFVALMLAYATALSYSELAKLYPGAGSSYLFAEQAFLSKTHAYRFARVAKFVIGWSSHLYYWMYPGVMVATMGIMIGYIVGTIAPGSMNAGIPGPVFMALIAIIFAYAVAWIAFRGVNGSTMVNIAINGIQIVALLFFSALAIAYRAAHPAGSSGLGLDSSGNAIAATLGAYGITGDHPSHASALSVILPHRFDWVMLQATVAILLLVGFESVTALGEEAINPKKDIPRGVLLSLTIQGLFCYLIEYFAANYFLNSAYSLAEAKGSAAPLGDMMVIIGNALLGGHGTAFMLMEALTVFLALIGTTLSCINTGARVTYAMGRDEEVPEHFGMLHGENLTPHRAIWVLATISAVLGAYAALFYFAGGSAPDDKTIATLPHNLWYSLGMSSQRVTLGVAQWLATGYAYFELRNLSALRPDEHRVHRRLLGASRVPWLQAHGGAGIWRDRKLRLPRVLHHRTAGGARQREGTVDGSRRSPGFGQSTAEFTSSVIPGRRAKTLFW